MEERNSFFILFDPCYHSQVPGGYVLIAGGSRAEIVISIALLPLSCSHKGLVFSFFFLFLRPMNRGLTNRVNCPRKAGRVIISFGMKIGTDRFNKRIKIYSILFTSTLFSVSTTFFHLIGD